ncbi:MAG TPA: PilN domain-containing protein [Burkholderiaceae bacterium]|nr:PilN domain-containing protein [Burkholderiaceae bacterium]
MIRINLLPHREMRRERRKKEFMTTAVLAAMGAAVVAFAGGVVINQMISTQEARNNFVKAENARLDEQIKEIRTLRDDIASLRARQQAVEDLQGDRTAPVHLLDELVRQTPDGIYLKQLRQEEMKVVMTGHAQSNEAIAELLRNLAERSAWLERPELVEIKAIVGPAAPGTREGRRAFEFSLSALIKRPNRQPTAPAQAAPRAQAQAPWHG